MNEDLIQQVKLRPRPSYKSEMLSYRGKSLGYGISAIVLLALNAWMAISLISARTQLFKCQWQAERDLAECQDLKVKPIKWEKRP